MFFSVPGQAAQQIVDGSWCVCPRMPARMQSIQPVELCHGTGQAVSCRLSKLDGGN